MITQKQRPPLNLYKETSISDAVDMIKAHVGDPPFSGENIIPTASKVEIVKWVRNCPITATLFFHRLNIPLCTYRNWIQFVVGSEFIDKKSRTKLQLTNKMWLSTAAKAIKTHIGDPPYKGQNQIPTECKMMILNWLRNHPKVSMKELASKIGLHSQTICKWNQDVAKSQGEKATKLADRKHPVSDRRRQAVRELAAPFPHQTGTARVPTLHLRNGARITGLTMAQLTELAKGLA